MSTSRHADQFEARLKEMGEAVAAQDLDALMAYYDDDLVFIEGGKAMNKAGLAEYLRELWATQPDFAAEIAAMHASADVLAVTLDASTSAVTSSGEVVKVRWPIFALYTFDLTTMKVVRELAFSDEEALAQKFAALGVA